jgi:glycosyltransferase involved in cell wall biosynthesis
MTTPSQPLVSVVIPAYNAERTLAQTLATVLEQDYAPFELIVVDDGSQDATSSIAEAAARNAGVRVIRQSNQGVAAARNAGIEAARGAIVALLDADDVWHPSFLSRQVEALEAAGPDAALAYCLSRAILPDETVFYSAPPAHATGDVYAALVTRNFIGNGSAAIIRRDALRAVGGFDASLRARGAQGCEDLDLYLKLARRHDFACTNAYLVGYRVAPGTMSTDLFRMLLSWDLVVGAEQARNPALSPRLVRWGRSSVLRWLWINARQQGEWRRAAGFLAQAVLHDPLGTFCYMTSSMARALSRPAPRTPPAASRSRFRDCSPDAFAAEDERCAALHAARAKRIKRPG